MWEEIKHDACENEKRNTRAIAEIEAIREFRESNKLDQFDVCEINSIIEKKIRKKQNEQANNQRLLKFYNTNSTVEDIFDKLNSVCTLFAELDSEMSKVSKYLKSKK